MNFKPSLKKNTINHVALIMDGNGRWAKKKGISKKLGHEAGVNNCIKICKNIYKINYQIKEISFYVFSTENWSRNPKEVQNLFDLIENFYIDFREVANDNNLIVRHCGSRKKLSKKLLNIIDDVTSKTLKNTGSCINLMFNYGSRQEIIDAITKMNKVKGKHKDLKKYLYLHDSHDPDLIIRTGGEKRLSNFMLWQSAYTELYFTKILWPDFNYIKLSKAIEKFYQRNRKYGK